MKACIHSLVWDRKYRFETPRPVITTTRTSKSRAGNGPASRPIPQHSRERPKSRVFRDRGAADCRTARGLTLTGSTRIGFQDSGFTGINVLAQRRILRASAAVTPLLSRPARRRVPLPFCEFHGEPLRRPDFGPDKQSSKTAVPCGNHIQIPVTPANRVLPVDTYIYNLNPYAPSMPASGMPCWAATGRSVESLGSGGKMSR